MLDLIYVTYSDWSIIYSRTRADQHCMFTDGRNHVPCCIDEGVPDICQDVCRGEYTMITDNIKTHFSCSAYTEKTLSCIVEGIGKHQSLHLRDYKEKPLFQAQFLLLYVCCVPLVTIKIHKTKIAFYFLLISALSRI